MQEAVKRLTELKHKLRWARKERSHRRGEYPAKGMGISFGGGRVIPGKLVKHPDDEALLWELLQSEPFTRMAGFADGE